MLNIFKTTVNGETSNNRLKWNIWWVWCFMMSNILYVSCRRIGYGLLVFQKIFPFIDYHTITIIFFRNDSFSICLKFSLVSNHYPDCIWSYNSVQKWISNVSNFHTSKHFNFRSSVGWYGIHFSNFFTLPIVPKCLNLTTVIRNTCSSFVLVFNLSLFNMDFGLPRSSFSRFSFAGLNFWHYHQMILSIIESFPKANLIFRYVCIVTQLKFIYNNLNSFTF